MEKQTTSQPSLYEQALINIARKLPVERVVQILDYARYIQSQTIEDFGFLNDDETEEEILVDEACWDAQFAATPDGLKKMADKVREDIQAGRTMPMVFTRKPLRQLSPPILQHPWQNPSNIIVRGQIEARNCRCGDLPEFPEELVLDRYLRTLISAFDAADDHRLGV